MDNLSSHTRKALVDRFGEKIGGLLWDRFTVHYTPKHGSWLNQAEIEISLFCRQCLGRRRIPSLRDLRREAKAWNRKMNRDRVTINWKFTRKKARRKFGYKRNKLRGQRPSKTAADPHPIIFRQSFPTDGINLSCNSGRSTPRP